MTDRDGATERAEDENEPTERREAWTTPTIVPLGGVVEGTLAGASAGPDGSFLSA